MVCVEYLVRGGFLTKQQWRQKMPRSRMAEQQKKMQVFLLPVSLKPHLASLPCIPHLSGFCLVLHVAEIHIFLLVLTAVMSTSWLQSPDLVLLGIFLVWLVFRVPSLAVFFSFCHFLRLDHSDGTVWSPLGWKPKWAREQEPVFLIPSPALLGLSEGDFQQQRRNSYLNTWVRSFFLAPDL